jgi:hypothetical protein
MRLALTCLLPALLLSGCGSSDARKAAGASAPFTVTEIARFNEPWAMTFLPDGRALVSEKAGALILWSGKAKIKTNVADIPGSAYGGQGGFGDVVLHPQFATNGMIYLSWVERDREGLGAVVGRAKLVESGNSARIEGLSIIWRQAPKVSGRGHFGHRIAFGPDGMLYISSGERQKFDPAQDMSGNLGKVVRLNDDGSIPGDNPFYSKGGVTAQIWVTAIRWASRSRPTGRFGTARWGQRVATNSTSSNVPPIMVIPKSPTAAIMTGVISPTIRPLIVSPHPKHGGTQASLRAV